MATAFDKIFENERAKQRTYAQEHGYTVNAGTGGFYVYEAGNTHGPLAMCTLEWDAIRIAYALARVFARGMQP